MSSFLYFFWTTTDMHSHCLKGYTRVKSEATCNAPHCYSQVPSGCFSLNAGADCQVHYSVASQKMVYPRGTSIFFHATERYLLKNCNIRILTILRIVKIAVFMFPQTITCYFLNKALGTSLDESKMLFLLNILLIGLSQAW